MRKSSNESNQQQVNDWLRIGTSTDLKQYFNLKNTSQSLTQNLLNVLRGLSIHGAQAFYENLQDLFFEFIDLQHGILTRKIHSDIFHTGVGYIRNARMQIPLNKRIDPNHPALFMANMMLRALSTLRAIDHTFSYRAQHNYQQQRAALKLNLVNLVSDVIRLQKRFDDDSINNLKLIIDLERTFNDGLIHILHYAGLDFGIDQSGSDQLYQQLLDHYRFISSTLDPAPSVVTIFQLKEFTHIEHSMPICTKSKQQITALEITRNLFPGGENNFHASKPLAFQFINQAFSDLMVMQNRALSAQMRHLVPPTVKNGFVVTKYVYHKNELIGCKNLLRCGSLVYVGNGETAETINNFTTNNFKQLETYSTQFAGKKTIHLSCLPTYSAFHSQALITTVTESVANQLGHPISYTPVNFEGLFRIPEFAKIIKNLEDAPFAGPSRKTTRALLAAKVVKLAQSYPVIIPLIFCASGQDRTGTLLTIINILEFVEYCKSCKVKIDFPAAEKSYIGARNQQFMATVLCPGAEGLKPCSKPGEVINKLAAKYLYLKTAKFNKKARITAGIAKKLAGNSPFLSNKQIVTQELTRYLDRRKGLFHGMMPFYNRDLTAQKIQMVKAALQTMSEALDYDNVIKTLDAENKSAVTQAKTSCLFCLIGNGELGNSIDRIRERLQSQDESKALSSSPNLTILEISH